MYISSLTVLWNPGLLVVLVEYSILYFGNLLQKCECSIFQLSGMEVESSVEYITGYLKDRAGLCRKTT